MGGEAVYIVGLSVFSELVALTAFGLVRPGARSSRGGCPGSARAGSRRTPRSPQRHWAGSHWSRSGRFAFRDVFTGHLPLTFAGDGWAALMVGCYAPLQL